MIFNYLNLSLIDIVFSFSYFLVLTKYFFIYSLFYFFFYLFLFFVFNKNIFLTWEMNWLNSQSTYFNKKISNSQKNYVNFLIK